MKNRGKYLVGFILVIGILLILMTTTFRSSLQYYVTVSELKAATIDYQKKVIKVAGIAKNIEKAPSVDGGGLVYDFLVMEGDQSIQVRYEGMIPDTFKEDSEVVITGNLVGDNELQASHILAKCASKYEAKLDSGVAN